MLKVDSTQGFLSSVVFGITGVHKVSPDSPLSFHDFWSWQGRFSDRARDVSVGGQAASKASLRVDSITLTQSSISRT